MLTGTKLGSQRETRCGIKQIFCLLFFKRLSDDENRHEELAR